MLRHGETSSPHTRSANAVERHGRRECQLAGAFVDHGHLTVDSGSTSASSDNPEPLDNINSRLWYTGEGRVQQLNRPSAPGMARLSPQGWVYGVSEERCALPDIAIKQNKKM